MSAEQGSVCRFSCIGSAIQGEWMTGFGVISRSYVTVDRVVELNRLYRTPKIQQHGRHTKWASWVGTEPHTLSPKIRQKSKFPSSLFLSLLLALYPFFIFGPSILEYATCTKTFGRKTDTKVDQVAAGEDGIDAVDDPLDDNTFDLDVWVQGINPTVEYVSIPLTVC